MNSSIKAIRSFNRFYTNILGLHEKYLLNSRFTLVEVRVMFEVTHAKTINARDLVNTLNIDKGYLSRVIKKLENNGLISRTKDTIDRRSLQVKMTAKGNLEFQSLNHASNEQIAGLTTHLDQHSLKELVNHMLQIKSILKNNQ
ncbi:MAG: MarR family winged helix-turn-helix transcriptional regulator [Marinicella sp.]